VQSKKKDKSFTRTIRITKRAIRKARRKPGSEVKIRGDRRSLLSGTYVHFPVILTFHSVEETEAARYFQPPYTLIWQNELESMFPNWEFQVIYRPRYTTWSDLESMVPGDLFLSATERSQSPANQ